MITDVFGNLGIACPACGDEYAHHGKVEVFERLRGEDGESYVMTSGSDLSLTEKNPSSRRNAVRIHYRGRVWPLFLYGCHSAQRQYLYRI
jgi:hypothetical protein